MDLVLVQAQLADAVFRKHQSRKSDFRTGKKLGIADHIVTWHKPKCRPKGMSLEEFAQLPDCVKVREVHFLIRQKGFRTKEIIVVTTLLDAKIYTKAQLAKLYRLRWEVEVDLQHVKTTLGMDELRGKTPQMVRKEIYVHLMAYNLLRILMWEAGITKGVSPLRKSKARHPTASSQLHPRINSCRSHKAHQTLSNPAPSHCAAACTRTSRTCLSCEFVNADPSLSPQMLEPRSVLKRQLAA